MADDDLRSLLLAWSWHMAREAVVADAHTDAAEVVFLETTFPRALLQAAGLADDQGLPTPAFDELLARAQLELPERLTLGEKLALLEGLVDAIAADGVLRAEEADALAAAAAMLGVDAADWQPLFAELSGRIRRE